MDLGRGGSIGDRQDRGDMIYVRGGYVDDDGRRCAETARLELHHCVPYADGGAHDAGNLQLRCKSHNALAAEYDFGRKHMARMSGGLPPEPRNPGRRPP